VYSLIAKTMLAPGLDFLRGTRTMRCLRELEQSQWWPRDKILELQNQRLRELVKHAYDNVPYYRHLFEERGLKPGDIENSEALVKLPVLTKRLIRENFDALLAQDFPAKDKMLKYTGGSTGEPLVFYGTRYESRGWGYAAAQRAYEWAGYKVGERCLMLRERRQYKSAVEKFRETLAQFFERSFLVEAKEMSATQLSLLTRKLEEFNPRFIRGFPSAIYLLARFIEREGKPRLRLKAIITTAEQLYDYQRDLFRQVFGVETYSHYGAREAHSIASECPEHHGYHIAAENVTVEIVDDAGEPVPVGKEGRILITNLHNYILPFIRYDIGDAGVSSDKACPCGRGLPLLGGLIGRTTDIILTKSGKAIPGLVLPWDIFAFLGAEQFQIVQESYDRVVVKIVLDREHQHAQAEKRIAEEVVRRYRPILGEDIDIDVEFVDHIPVTKTGKRRVVVSNLIKE
jgi:phenylacetate-CoA ligase